MELMIMLQQEIKVDDRQPAITIGNWIKAYGKRIRQAVALAEQRPSDTRPITAYFQPRTQR